MEIIKKKITLDNYTSRNKSNWGSMTANTFDINVFFTQDGDDMGISTEAPFIAHNGSTLTYPYLTPKLAALGVTFSFLTGATTSITKSGAYPSIRYPSKPLIQYFINGMPVSGLTEDRLDVVSSYDANLKYKPGFDITKGPATDFQGTPYTVGTRVISNAGLDPITYLINGDTSPSELAALPNAKRGVYYTTSTGTTRAITGTIFPDYDIPVTTMNYTSEGFNDTNVHLSAETKEEYLFGITSTPTVFNDLFIDRGRATVIQSHMQLADIRNMSELINYGNGFYKIQN